MHTVLIHCVEGGEHVKYFHLSKYNGCLKGKPLWELKVELALLSYYPSLT